MLTTFAGEGCCSSRSRTRQRFPGGVREDVPGFRALSAAERGGSFFCASRLRPAASSIVHIVVQNRLPAPERGAVSSRARGRNTLLIWKPFFACTPAAGLPRAVFGRSTKIVRTNFLLPEPPGKKQGSQLVNGYRFHRCSPRGCCAKRLFPTRRARAVEGDAAGDDARRRRDASRRLAG